MQMRQEWHRAPSTAGEETSRNRGWLRLWERSELEGWRESTKERCQSQSWGYLRRRGDWQA